MQLIEQIQNLTTLAAEYPAAPYAAAALGGAALTLIIARRAGARRLELSALGIAALGMGGISAALNGAGGAGMLDGLPAGIIYAACALMGALVPVATIAARAQAHRLAHICFALSIALNVFSWHAALSLSDARRERQTALIETAEIAGGQADAAAADQAALRQTLTGATETARLAAASLAAAQSALSAHGTAPAIAREADALRADLAEAEAQLSCELNGPVGCAGQGGLPILQAGPGKKSRALAASIDAIKAQIAQITPDLAPAIAEHSARAAEQQSALDAARDELAAARAAEAAATADLREARQAAASASASQTEARQAGADLAEDWPVLIATARVQTTVETFAGKALGLTAATVTLLLSLALALVTDLTVMAYARARRPRRIWRGILGEISTSARWIWHGDTAPAQIAPPAPEPEPEQIAQTDASAQTDEPERLSLDEQIAAAVAAAVADAQASAQAKADAAAADLRRQLDDTRARLEAAQAPKIAQPESTAESAPAADGDLDLCWNEDAAPLAVVDSIEATWDLDSAVDDAHPPILSSQDSGSILERKGGTVQPKEAVKNGLKRTARAKADRRPHAWVMARQCELMEGRTADQRPAMHAKAWNEWRAMSTEQREAAYAAQDAKKQHDNDQRKAS